MAASPTARCTAKVSPGSATGEHIYVSGGLEPGAPLDRDQYWPTDFQFKRPAWPNYHARQIQELVGAIAAGRKPLVDGVEGRKSVAILLAIYESQRTGQPVSPG
jgi:predicted dehydrogenase